MPVHRMKSRGRIPIFLRMCAPEPEESFDFLAFLSLDAAHKAAIETLYATHGEKAVAQLSHWISLDAFPRFYTLPAPRLENAMDAFKRYLVT